MLHRDQNTSHIMPTGGAVLMRAKTFQYFYSARAVTPYLWGFAAAAALDHLIDVQTVFLPIIAVAAAVNAGCLILRRAGR